MENLDSLRILKEINASARRTTAVMNRLLDYQMKEFPSAADLLTLVKEMRIYSLDAINAYYQGYENYFKNDLEFLFRTGNMAAEFLKNGQDNELKEGLKEEWYNLINLLKKLAVASNNLMKL